MESSKFIKPIICDYPTITPPPEKNSKALKYKNVYTGMVDKISRVNEMLDMYDKLILAEAKRTGDLKSPKKFYERFTPSENDPNVIESKNRQMKSSCLKKIEAMKKTEEFLIESRKTIESPTKKKKVDVKKMLEDFSIARYM